MRILTNNNILDILFKANCLLYNCLFLKRVHIVNLKKILFINTIMFTIINYDSYQRLNLHIMQCYYDSNHQIAYMSVFSVQTFTHCVVFSVKWILTIIHVLINAVNLEVTAFRTLDVM